MTSDLFVTNPRKTQLMVKFLKKTQLMSLKFSNAGVVIADILQTSCSLSLFWVSPSRQQWLTRSNIRQYKSKHLVQGIEWIRIIRFVFHISLQISWQSLTLIIINSNIYPKYQLDQLVYYWVILAIFIPYQSTIIHSTAAIAICLRSTWYLGF